jgi:LacI family transcriptional regulator
LITVKEIARECNVSPSTVSNILNGKSNVGEETRKRVLEFVKASGYQPNYFAQSMRKTKSRIISILTEDLLAFGTDEIVESIMAYCDDNNYRTILMNLRLYERWRDTWYNDTEKLRTVLTPVLQEALSIRVDGLIYVAGHCRIIDHFPKELPIPAVISYGIAEDERYSSVLIDDEKGGYDVAQYLLSRGHRKIGVIAGVMNNLHTKDRLLGFQKALFEAGILFNPDWVRYGNWDQESGYREAKRLAHVGVTAIFCMNDRMAEGAYDCLYDEDLIPGKDISVAGYDNMHIARVLRPRLTTNEIQLRVIGAKSAELLLNSLAGGAEAAKPTVLRVPCRLVERESVRVLEG